ncbi:hypothetical protein D3C86_913540 [compost metagenome]
MDEVYRNSGSASSTCALSEIFRTYNVLPFGVVPILWSLHKLGYVVAQYCIFATYSEYFGYAFQVSSQAAVLKVVYSSTANSFSETLTSNGIPYVWNFLNCSGLAYASTFNSTGSTLLWLMDKKSASSLNCFWF